jgi:hypothetical protein
MWKCPSRRAALEGRTGVRPVQATKTGSDRHLELPGPVGAAPGLPRGHRAAPGWSLVPLHHRRAGQGADRGEPGRVGAALLRPLGSRGAGTGRGDPAARGPVHQDGGDQGGRPVRAAAGQRSSALAHVRYRHRVRARVRRHHRRAPVRGPSFASSDVGTRERGSRPARGQTRRDRPAHRGPAPYPLQRRQALGEEARSRSRRTLTFYPRRHDGAGAGGGARPAPREAGPGARPGEAAADRASAE